MLTYLYYGTIRNRVAYSSKSSHFPTHRPLFYQVPPCQSLPIHLKTAPSTKPEIAIHNDNGS
jgi:hypothetical protein